MGSVNGDMLSMGLGAVGSVNDKIPLVQVGIVCVEINSDCATSDSNIRSGNCGVIECVAFVVVMVVCFGGECGGVVG